MLCLQPHFWLQCCSRIAAPLRQQTSSMARFQGWGDYQLSEDRTAGVKVCGIIFLLLNEEVSDFHFSLFHSSVFTFHLFLLTLSCSYNLGLSSKTQKWILTSLLHNHGNFLFTHISTIGKYPTNSYPPLFLFPFTAHKTPLNKQKTPNQSKNPTKLIHEVTESILLPAQQPF